MRPKLRPDVYYVPTRDGAFIIDSARSVTLRGGSIYNWVERLAPSLDGTATLDELTTGLQPAHRKMVGDLVSLLESNGFVRDVGDDLPHGLTDEELERYQAEIAYVDFRCDSGPARFERWRGTRLVIVGSAPLADAAARAAWELGCRRVEIVDPSDDAEARSGRADDARALREEDSERELVETPASELSSAVAAADFVVALTEDPELIDTVAEACTAPLLPVLVSEDVAWVGPNPGGSSTWADAKARWIDTGVLPVGPSTWMIGPATGVPANTALFAAFRLVTGAYPEPVADELERIDLETLESETSRVLPVGRVAKTDPTEWPESIESEAFSLAAARLFDRFTGPLLEIEEHRTQLPLRVAVASLARDGEVSQALGVADSLVDARHDATLAALGRLAASHPSRGPAVDILGGGTGPNVEPVGVGDPRVPGIGAALDRESALTAAVLDLAAERAAPTPSSAPQIDLGGVPEALGEQVRRLESLTRETVRAFRLDAELPTVLVVAGEEPLARACGLDTAGALATALERATLVAQCGHDPITMPPIPESAPESEGSTDTSTGPVLTTEDVVKLLASRGTRLGIIELDGEPILRTATPYLIRVVEL